jgi:hypothetical protein
MVKKHVMLTNIYKPSRSPSFAVIHLRKLQFTCKFIVPVPSTPR